MTVSLPEVMPCLAKISDDCTYTILTFKTTEIGRELLNAEPGVALIVTF